MIDGKAYSYLTTYAKREFTGSSIPDAYGSFNFTASWKGLTLSTLFTYQIGGKVMEYNYADLLSPGNSPKALHKDALKSWRYENATATDAIDPNGFPILSNAATLPSGTAPSLTGYSSRFLIDASYLVLKNINLTYQLPKSLVRKIDLEGVGLTVTCENLFTLTHLKGMNPQQSFNGYQYNYLNTPRVFSVGLNIKL